MTEHDRVEVLLDLFVTWSGHISAYHWIEMA